MKLRYLTGALAAGVLFVAQAGVAVAQAGVAGAQAPITLSSGPYEVASKDGKQTLALTVTNATNAQIIVSLAPQSGECTITADPEFVDAHRSSKVVFTVEKVCPFSDKGVIDLRFTANSTPQLTTDLRAQLAVPKTPTLGDLWLYAWAAGGALLLVVFIAMAWLCRWIADPKEPEAASTKTPTTPTTPPPTPPAPGIWRRLPGLASDWSFTDSWSSNVGLAAAVFTGVLGATDVLKEILGEGSESQVSTAVVSAALTAGLIGSAPLVLAIFRNSRAKDHDERSHNVVMGVLIASALVLAATIGQILVMARVVIDAEVISSVAVDALKLGAIGVLVVYAIQSIPVTLTEGLIPPKKTPSDSEVAAGIISEAILKAGGIAEQEYPTVLSDLRTSLGDSDVVLLQRRRSAMP